MNADRLLALADLLESDEVQGHFSMTMWVRGVEDRLEYTIADVTHTCGAAACMGGYAEAMYRMTDEAPKRGYITTTETKIWLDLSFAEFDALFYPPGITPQDFEYIKLKDPKLAAKVVRHFVATTRVDWSVIDELIDKSEENSV
jgi:hypothetical protein